MTRLISYQDALSAPEPPWTVAGVLSGLCLLWGEPGVGKTFVACSLAASVASGRPWLGHRVTAEGPVVYVAGEGGAASLSRRLEAAIGAVHCCDEDDGPTPLWIVTPGVDLVAGPADLVATIGSVTPRLIIIDTLARCFGGDENSSEDMTKFVRTLDMLRELYACTVLVIHHANKSDRSGSGKVRGSSVLYGAVDVSMQITRAAYPQGEYLLIADKLRDREVTDPIAQFRFEHRVLHGQYDDLGDVRTTRTVLPSAEFERAVIEVARIPMATVVTYETWRAACPRYNKGTFDRLATAVLGDPGTWGVHEIVRGVYGFQGGGSVPQTIGEDE